MSHPRDILLSLEAGARKSLSQNFLTSPHWAERLATLAVNGLSPGSFEVDEIWEIGPGLGALTRELVKRTTKPIRLFEYDRKLSAYLREQFPKLELIEGDVMDADLPALSSGKRISVLSNLPYHLSSPIFFRLLEIKAQTAQLVLTFQKEFAERLIAVPRTHAYGGLTVMAQLNYSLHSLGVIPPGAFYPAPAVASEAVAFVPKTASAPTTLSPVVRAAFSHRRKKLSRNLQNVFPNVEWEAELLKLGLTATARPEELTKDQYVTLASRVSPEPAC